MIRPYAFLAKPFDFKGLCKIYPPTVNEVIDNEFEVYLSILTISQDDLNDEFEGQKDEEGNFVYVPTPFEYLLGNAYINEDFLNKANNALKFFLHEPCTVLPEAEAILIGNLEEQLQNVQSLDDLNLLKKDDYFDFQNQIRAAIGREPIENPEDLNKLHWKVREMKLKAKMRDKIKAKQEAKKAPTLETSLASICCMGIGLTPLNIGEISYASVGKLIETNQKREKYDLDCRSLLMGAKPEKIKMQYWIRNSDD